MSSYEKNWLREEPFANVNMSMFLSNTVKDFPFPRSEEEARETCDKIIQAYIDSRQRPLTLDEELNVEDTIEYLVGRTKILLTKENIRRGRMDGVAVVISLGSRALMNPVEAVNVDDADTPQPTKDQLIEITEREERQAALELESTFLDLYESEALTPRMTQALMLAFNLRPSSAEYTKTVRSDLKQLLGEVILLIEEGLKDHEGTRRKNGQTTYQNPVIQNGMDVLQGFIGIVGFPGFKNQLPINAYVNNLMSREGGVSNEEKRLTLLNTLKSVRVVFEKALKATGGEGNLA